MRVFLGHRRVRILRSRCDPLLERGQRMNLAVPVVRTASLPLMKARDSVGPLYGVGFIRSGSNGD